MTPWAAPGKNIDFERRNHSAQDRGRQTGRDADTDDLSHTPRHLTIYSLSVYPNGIVSLDALRG